VSLDGLRRKRIKGFDDDILAFREKCRRMVWGEKIEGRRGLAVWLWQHKIENGPRRDGEFQLRHESLVAAAACL
jgi:hypothetical protein